MVKSKRDIKSPKRKNALTLNRPLTRSKATSSTSVQATPAAANVKVVVRVRPPNEREKCDAHRIVVKVVDNQMLVFDPKEEAQPFFYHGVQQRGRDLLKRANKDLQFVFDKVFGFQANNFDVFHDTTQSLITTLMDGYNCSVFAYGATGAGKTHTMLGQDGNPGITYLTMAELFKQKNNLMNERDFELGITYLEVYNELVQDLLNPGSTLHLREDGKYGVMVAGNKIHKIDDPDELFSLLEQGNKNRTQHPTDANAESSRSHAVFQVYIQMNIRATSEMRTAKLSMIDLAGSERGAATGFAGARFTEGANINKSLLALGNCINSLADGQRHVPYRDSKLTRLLKDSLGGNCQTVMIANISPSSLSYEDTYNTLKYATRAKKIKSNMKKNVVNVELHVGQYVKMVEELNKEVERLKTELKDKNNTVKPVEPALSEQLLKMYTDIKQLLHRIHQIESSEKVLLIRRQIKQEADSRLSGLCADSPDRHDGHRRLGNTVNRCHRQEQALKDELFSLEGVKNSLVNKIHELVKKNPQLKQLDEVETAKLNELEASYKADLAKKESDLLREELKLRGNLLERMSRVLQPCYIQLRGLGFATDNLMKDYQSLIAYMQGIKNVTWDDDSVDSGVSSSQSISTNEETRPTKRKCNDDFAVNSMTSLDSTFVMTPSKPKVKVCAGQLLAKVHRSPSAKRVAKLKSASPRLKENRLYRKPLGTVDNGNKISRAAGDRHDIHNRRAAPPPVQRPAFRR